jgi:hypothetical protein
MTLTHLFSSQMLYHYRLMVSFQMSVTARRMKRLKGCRCLMDGLFPSVNGNISYIDTTKINSAPETTRQTWHSFNRTNRDHSVVSSHAVCIFSRSRSDWVVLNSCRVSLSGRLLELPVNWLADCRSSNLHSVEKSPQTLVLQLAFILNHGHPFVATFYLDVRSPSRGLAVQSLVSSKVIVVELVALNWSIHTFRFSSYLFLSYENIRPSKTEQFVSSTFL